MIKNLNKAEILKFLLVGGTAFVVDYVIFLVAYYLLTLGVKPSSFISYTTAFAYSFFMQKYWTFKSQDQNNKTSFQLIANLALAGFNLVFATYATAYFVELGILPAIVRPAIFGLIMVWNFVLYKKVIFK